jgi:transmembrane sensor
MFDEIKILFQRYLNNECSEAELEKLLQFFGNDENGQWLMQVIGEELEREVDETQLDTTDVDSRLQVIYKGIAPAPKINYWRRIAAAAAVLAILSTGILYLSHKEHQKPAIAQAVIKPGKNQAILRLSNGSAIILNDAANGEVANQSGIHITKTANGQIIYEDKGDANGPLQYNSIEAPAGGQWELVLPDKSHVWLNSKTILKYPTRFQGAERKVELEGEAYFEVAPDQSKPFKVVSKKQTVQVLGTHFDMMSYPDDATNITTLFEGAVKVNGQVLKPGQQATITTNNIQLNTNPDLEEAIAWKNGYFKFNGRLEDIMSKVSRWYDVKIVFKDKAALDYTFEGEISRNKNLNEILNIIAYTGRVHFSVNERTIEVTK